MRSLILLTGAFILWFSQPVSAQLTEINTTSKDWTLYGHVKYVGPAKASLEYIVNDHDSTFLLLMYDMRDELNQYFSIRFSSQGNTVERLYEQLMSFFDKDAGKKHDTISRFQLGDENVSVYRATTIGIKGIVLSTDKGRMELGKGEIKRLFNK
jgi:hypothetical protein